MKTIVVNMNREEYDIDITRNSKWGNPYKIGFDGSRQEVIKKYEKYLMSNEELLNSLNELKGKKLGCHCKPKACHGDVLSKLANSMNIFIE